MRVTTDATVTRSGAERALSSRPPSLTNDASSSVCAPGLSAGSCALHAKVSGEAVPVGEVAHEAVASAVRVLSTYTT